MRIDRTTVTLQGVVVEAGEKCVLAAFKTLEFPPPVSGIVTVVYPIQLKPG